MDADDPHEALNATSSYVDQGYTAIKYYGWDGFGKDKSRDTDLLQTIRSEAGGGIDLMLDLGRPASLSEAIHTARMIEDSGADIYWWEEPLSSSDDLENLTRLTERTDVTIAAGESELTSFRFHEMLRQNAVDLLQPDLSWVGGITEGKRISEMARQCNVPVVPHNWGTAINFAASIHLVASMPRGFLCEYPVTPRTWGKLNATPTSPMMSELAINPIVIEDGFALVPDGPGIGIELNQAAVDQYTVT